MLERKSPSISEARERRTRTFLDRFPWSKEEPKDQENLCKNASRKFKFLDTLKGLLQHGEQKDITLLTIGCIASTLAGCTYPLMSLVMNNVTQLFFRASESMQYPAFWSNSSIPFLKWSHNRRSSTDFMNKEDFLNEVNSCSINYLGVAIFTFTLNFIMASCWECAAENHVFRLRKIYFKQILRQNIGWFEENGDGDLSTKLTDDMERIRFGLGSKAGSVLHHLSQLFIGLAVGFYLNWKLTIVLFFIGPIFIACNASSARMIMHTSKFEQLRYGVAGGIALEALIGIKTVAAFGGERTEVKRYDEAIEEGRKMTMKKYYMLGAVMGLSHGLVYAVYALSFWYSSVLFIQEEISSGEIVGVLFSVVVAAYAVGHALPIVTEVAAAFGSADLVLELVNRVPKIDPYSKEGLVPKKIFGSIRFTNVTFAYPARKDVEVLKGLSIEIAPGSVVALVGASGAGKSTIVSLLTRLYDPTSGEIFIDGHQLDMINLSWLRKQIGVVSQEPCLFDVSIYDNICYGGDKVTRKEVEEAAKLANAHDFIINLPQGYDTQVGEMGTQISVGQKQRIAIARALVRNPQLLLLDEATSALDAESEALVQTALNNAMQGRTTIIIAHRLTTIRNVDKIYAMKDGLVIESGTHAELMQHGGFYYNLVKMQKSGQDQTIQKKHHSAESFESKEKKVSYISPKTTVGEKIIDVSDGDFVAKSESLSDWKGRQVLHQNLVTEQPSKQELENYSSAKVSSLSAHAMKKPKSEVHLKSNGGVTCRDLMKLYSKHWVLMLWSVIGCSFNGFHLPFFSVIYSEFIGVLISPDDNTDYFRGKVFDLVEVLAVLSVMVTLSYCTCVLACSTTNEKLIRDVRIKTFTNLLLQQVSWFDLEDFIPVKLNNVLAREPPIIKSLAGMRAGIILECFFCIALSLVVAFITSWKLALMVFAFLPLAVFASLQLRFSFNREAKQAESLQKSSKIASEAIHNIRTVQLLSLQNFLMEKYESTLSISYKINFRQGFHFAFSYSLSQCTFFFIASIIYKYGSDYVVQGELDFVDVFRVILAIGFSYSSWGTLCHFTQDFMKSKASLKTVFKLMSIKPELSPFDEKGIKPEIKGKVTFKNISFSYPTRKHIHVLKNLDFTIEPGQTIALVGSSGSGKSSIISLLERFYFPDSGQILIDDIDISHINVGYLRSELGFVTQEPMLFDCSIKDNIAYGALASGKEVSDLDIIEAARKANIHDFICSLPQGYDTLAGEKGTQLSGGQKQRVAIARALIRNPKILLLDEATSALDNESEKLVQAALDKAREGRTSLIIAHRLSTIRNADSIIVLKDGNIIEQGTHSELKKRRGYYYNLIKKQDDHDI